MWKITLEANSKTIAQVNLKSGIHQGEMIFITGYFLNGTPTTNKRWLL